MQFSRTFAYKLTILSLFWFAPIHASAGPYIEAGTSLGAIKSGDAFFGQRASSSGTGFVGSLSLYFTAFRVLGFSHFDIGIQNRLSLAGTDTGKQLAMFTPNIAIRYEFLRFFVGGGFAPLAYGSTSGVSGLKANSSATSYFLEGGAIWRVIPEFQIVAAVGMEMGLPTGAASPINTEYGLRFRFPLNPKEDSVTKGVKWDGFRYPFGVMRD